MADPDRTREAMQTPTEIPADAMEAARKLDIEEKGRLLHDDPFECICDDEDPSDPACPVCAPIVEMWARALVSFRAEVQERAEKAERRLAELGQILAASTRVVQPEGKEGQR